MMRIVRGAKRTAKPDIFISHSSLDKLAATRLATVLNFCSIDVWLDDWELEVGQSLTDEVARAMEDSKYIAILITDNYNSTVWTKTEYKKALSREQRENRTVMLPLIIEEANVPHFIEDKVYVDLRNDYFSGVTRLVGLVHEISNHRLSRAISSNPPTGILQIWNLLESIGFSPYVVFGKDDFDEILKHGGKAIKEDFANFYPEALLSNPAVSDYINL